MDQGTSSKIKAWQDSLFDAFSHNGVLGGAVLSSVLEAEPLVGGTFINKYYGHRVLADSFMEFFGRTLMTQLAFNQTNGWPQNQPHYATCLMMYLTMFRAFRSSELLALHGYPMQGYVIQRSLKDQAFALCAAANGLARFGELFGWEGVQGNLNEQQAEDVVKSRRKAEARVVDQLIGSKSGLSEETQAELQRWDRLFNWEAHRGLLTLYTASDELLKNPHNTSVVPATSDMTEAMYMNRCHEVGWMILRLLPFMRRSETAHDRWNDHWKLLDDSFRMMNEGFGDLGKKIAPAMAQLIMEKFSLTPDRFYSEA